MNIPIYQVDAFTNKQFGGNPAAVCPLTSWLDDEVLQAIAAENNLSETAFFVYSKNNIELRWFTPEVEVALCGHATLATAHVLFEHLLYEKDTIHFSTKSGILIVEKGADKLIMNFPTDLISEVEIPSNMTEVLGAEVLKAYKGKTDYLFILNNEQTVASLKPNFYTLSELKCRAVIVSAQGEQVDFVSRVFAPQSGIDEDPVTGSAHTTLTPYWAEILDKKELSAQQISKRGGELYCKLLGERVEISGQAVTYLVGNIIVD